MYAYKLSLVALISTCSMVYIDNIGCEVLYSSMCDGDGHYTYYYNNIIMIVSFPTGSDFTGAPITLEVPAATNDRPPVFEIPMFFNVTDDDIDEYGQSFAIFAELGPDVSDRIACFQLQTGETECFGRRGATEIRITDNDRKQVYS